MSEMIRNIFAAKVFGGAGGSSGGGGIPQADIEAAFAALAEKGVTVPDGATSADLDDLIASIVTGGGGAVAVSPKEVNFYDYDGTCVHAYTVEEAQALSKLPAGPEHPGLVFQGWNWSLEGVKGLTRAMNIGAMYTTDDGTTRLYITLQEGRTSPMLGVGVNGTVTVDWGDGTEPDVLTGTSISTTKWTPNHAYAKPGDYVIRLAVDGGMAFTGSGTGNYGACILRHTSDGDNRNGGYQHALQKVEIGSCVASIGEYAFASCRMLSSVTIPNSVTSIGGNYICYNGRRLTSVTIPNSVTSIGNATFQGITGLTSVMIPESVTSIGSKAFYSCGSIASLTIPDSVTSIGDNAFYSCSGLALLTISKNVSNIGAYAFRDCTSLTTVKIPDAMTNIGANVFYACPCVAYYDFTACTAVLTLENTSAFTGIPADCEIRVPAALYDEWIAATNWATYADYIKAY